MKEFFSPNTRFPSAMPGSFLVALAYAIGGFGAHAILSDNADLHTRAGRHLLAGALAIINAGKRALTHQCDGTHGLMVLLFPPSDNHSKSFQVADGCPYRDQHPSRIAPD